MKMVDVIRIFGAAAVATFFIALASVAPLLALISAAGLAMSTFITARALSPHMPPIRIIPRLLARKHRNPGSNRADRFPSLGLLNLFYWLCFDKESRDLVSLVKHDLVQDIRDMKKEKRNKAFIHFVVLWHSIASGILPIFWDGVVRVLSRLFPVAKLVKYVKGKFW